MVGCQGTTGTWENLGILWGAEVPAGRIRICSSQINSFFQKFVAWPESVDQPKNVSIVQNLTCSGLFSQPSLGTCGWSGRLAATPSCQSHRREVPEVPDTENGGGINEHLRGCLV